MAWHSLIGHNHSQNTLFQWEKANPQYCTWLVASKQHLDVYLITLTKNNTVHTCNSSLSAWAIYEPLKQKFNEEPVPPMHQIISKSQKREMLLIVAYNVESLVFQRAIPFCYAVSTTYKTYIYNFLLESSCESIAETKRITFLITSTHFFASRHFLPYCCSIMEYTSMM